LVANVPARAAPLAAQRQRGIAGAPLRSLLLSGEAAAMPRLARRTGRSKVCPRHAGLHRDPPRRKGPHRGRVRRARPGLVRRPRHHRPAPSDRQRVDLHPQPRPARPARRARHPPPHDPAAHAQAQRQGRAHQQTLAREWAYGQRYRDSDARAAALPIWLEHYNYVGTTAAVQPAADQPRSEPAEARQLERRSLGLCGLRLCFAA
jgi:hypothetical protein